MKRRVLLVFVVVVLAPVFVATQNQPSRPDNRQKTQQTNAPPTVSTNKSGGDDARKGTNNPQWWDKFVTWPEGIATLALILTLCAIIWQAVETRRSVGAVANSQRSWLITIGVDRPDLQQVWINKASIRFKVIGNSPLRLLEGNLTYEVVPSKVDGPPGSFGSFVPNLPKRPKYGDIIDYTNSPSLGKVHPPDGEVGIATSLESTILTAQDVKALEDGECFLCVYGFMRYKDPVVSWKRRETRYCFAC
jgi:hypothetical protein